MAALKTLSYELCFSMFGLGHVESFHEILDLKLSPYLSAPCYQYWKANVHVFTQMTPLYMHGFSGSRRCVIDTLFKITRRSGDVDHLCTAGTITDQDYFWAKKIRSMVLNRLTVFLLSCHWLSNHVLGVSENQKKMLLAEGTVRGYVRDTLDPVLSSGLLSDGDYHYLMVRTVQCEAYEYLTCLCTQMFSGRYNQTSCPSYLTEQGFETLRADDGKRMDSIRIHTDTLTGFVLVLVAPNSALLTQV